MIYNHTRNRKGVMSNEKADAAFSVRLEKVDKDILGEIAKLQQTSSAALARKYILEGISRDLDPAAIELHYDRLKEHMIATTTEFRERREKSR